MQQRSHESSDVKSLINELSLRIGEARERKDVAGQLTIQSCPGNSVNGVKNGTNWYNQAFPPLSEIGIKTQTACSLDTKHSVWYSKTPPTCEPIKETSQKNESSNVTQTAEMSPKNGLLHKRSNRLPCEGKENELLPGKDGISLVKQNIPDIGKEHQLRCNNFESEWFERTGELDVKVVPTTTIKASVDEGHGANLYVGMEDDAVFKQLRAATKPTRCRKQLFTTQTSRERSDQTMPSIFADDKTDLVGSLHGLTIPYLSTDSVSSYEDHILVKTDVFEQLDSSCRLNASGRNGMDVSIHPDDADIESVDGPFMFLVHPNFLGAFA
ncbi:hypothetical protein C0Q70_08895 [Pomacea canaliculata]|uniref:Uncharacterized protein n=1 Tax=Pomacea canaliculata TaxID=400727 RepID=A0A2T7P897_POMCA|nr:hypothetical protein C0Q70_08895 [Pomacea canaliculata]